MPTLQIEPLEVTLKQVTFDASKLHLWPNPRVNCSCPSYPWSTHLGPDYHAKLFNLLHKLLHADGPYRYKCR